mmetsp:Transcript_26958/g.71553  ORF Transcript_26958/g.71553 Transcript_26958/m.71553 type:complete len:102 (+) Transcript_26958:515-820(+)
MWKLLGIRGDRCHLVSMGDQDELACAAQPAAVFGLLSERIMPEWILFTGFSLGGGTFLVQGGLLPIHSSAEEVCRLEVHELELPSTRARSGIRLPLGREAQ